MFKGVKQFTTPFDAMYSYNIDNIIEIFNNGINYDDLISSENIILHWHFINGIYFNFII